MLFCFIIFSLSGIPVVKQYMCVQQLMQLQYQYTQVCNPMIQTILIKTIPNITASL